MLTIGRSGRTVSFAAVSLPGSSNEDRHSVSLSTLKQKVRSVDDVDGDFHAFGIFDGHDGRLASEECAKRLFPLIGEIYHSLKTSRYFSATKVLPQRVKEALFCEALHRAIALLHDEITQNGDGGSTLNALFLFPVHEDNSLPGKEPSYYRALVANVGDSRCVLLTCNGGANSASTNASIHTSTNNSASNSVNNSTSMNRSRARSNSNGISRSISASTSVDNSQHHSPYPLHVSVSTPSITVAEEAMGSSSSKRAVAALSSDDQDESITPCSDTQTRARTLSNTSHVTTYNNGSNINHGTDDSGGHSNHHVSDKRQQPLLASSQLLHLSEDHNLRLQRELFRITTKQRVRAQSQPFPLTIQSLCARAMETEALSSTSHATSWNQATSLVDGDIKQGDAGGEVLETVMNLVPIDFSALQPNSGSTDSNSPSHGKAPPSLSQFNTSDDNRYIASTDDVGAPQLLLMQPSGPDGSPLILAHGPNPVAQLFTCTEDSDYLQHLQHQTNHHGHSSSHDTSHTGQVQDASGLSSVSESALRLQVHLGDLREANRLMSGLRTFEEQKEKEVEAQKVVNEGEKKDMDGEEDDIRKEIDDEGSSSSDDDDDGEEEDNEEEKARFLKMRSVLGVHTASAIMNASQSQRDLHSSKRDKQQSSKKPTTTSASTSVTPRTPSTHSASYSSSSEKTHLVRKESYFAPRVSSKHATATSSHTSSGSSRRPSHGLFGASKPTATSHSPTHSHDADGTTVVQGPLAYFGRFDRSLLMMRSVGDRFGPRGCIPLAEVTSVTLSRHRHCRFVLSSDGLWDVVDSDTVRRHGLCSRHLRASSLATSLAHKAQRRRERLSMRKDDISVLVVDLGIHNGIFLKTHKTTACAATSAMTYHALVEQHGSDFDVLDGNSVVVGGPRSTHGSSSTMDVSSSGSRRRSNSHAGMASSSFYTASSATACAVPAMQSDHARAYYHYAHDPHAAVSVMPLPKDSSSATENCIIA